MKRFLFLVPALTSLLLIFLLPSCKKDNNKIIVECNVNDPNTGIALEGATVVFSSSRITDGVYNSGYEEIARTTTDASGNFRFETDEDYTSGYRITISKDGYFQVSLDISTDEIKAGTTYTHTFNMYPIGFIKLHVVNNGPYDANDFIAYTFSSGYVGCYECCDNSWRYGYGMSVNEYLKCKTYGNQNVTLTWNVTKNQEAYHYTRTVYCTANDTLNCLISY